MLLHFRCIWLLLLVFVGCTEPTSVPAPSPAPPTPVPTTPANPVSYLALGDSYTIGQSVPATDRWGVQLAQLAQAEGVQTPDIIAQTGWTTGELQHAITAANVQKTYGLVSLMIGVNNQYRGLPLDTYRTEFRQLLQTAIQLAGGRPRRVFVLSIPDWGQTPTGRSYPQARISQEIDQFNAVAREECSKVTVEFVDITDLTRATNSNPAQFAPDGLHYSGLHMGQWANRALPVVRVLLK
ncbi:SGNH/GDSL hydrolase family protein [Hymenobacter endophyticus]|uniref:SGNH/GDSL hydrolase family protein n=1 Tax=Hymenobacter endophyticus TaxID=3076335 RepID=A0ABU3TKH8_9BACT|nr:SGNH/GDSL hydrolase family protein [Hymenobacter endophyticus]MDU0371870.1 SGNH/GDSL hydrolase family protein [Hymenobacter endophyticus]